MIAARMAGQVDEEFEEMKGSKSSWNVLNSMKEWMIRFLQTHGFWGVLLMSAWPNMAFDLCGVCASCASAVGGACTVSSHGLTNNARHMLRSFPDAFLDFLRGHADRQGCHQGQHAIRCVLRYGQFYDVYITHGSYAPTVFFITLFTDRYMNAVLNFTRQWAPAQINIADKLQDLLMKQRERFHDRSHGGTPTDEALLARVGNILMVALIGMYVQYPVPFLRWPHQTLRLSQVCAVVRRAVRAEACGGLGECAD